MKELIVLQEDAVSRISVNNVGPLGLYSSVKTPYFYVADNFSTVCIYYGDSTRRYEFDFTLYDPKDKDDFMALRAALEYYLVEKSLELGI